MRRHRNLNKVSSSRSALKTLWRQWNRLEVKTGKLYQKVCCRVWKRRKMHLVVPVSKRNQVNHYRHDISTAAHLGNEKVLGKIR